jgi:hypothetical protein
VRLIRQAINDSNIEIYVFSVMPGELNLKKLTHSSQAENEFLLGATHSG